MMRSKTVVLSLVILMMLGTTALFAQQRGRPVTPSGAVAPAAGQPQPGPGPDAMGPLGPIGRCLAAIGLTDAQKADIKALVEAEIPTLQALHETMKADEEAVRDAIETNPEPCAVGTAVMKVHADREAIRAELEALRTKLEALLTTEQKLKLVGCLAGLNSPKP